MKQHPCPTCDKRFSERTAMIIHVRTHTGEKPYHCHLCKKAFTASGNLIDHLNRHNEIKYEYLSKVI